MRICYFVSEYPAVSHTFIRREIVELERTGFDVVRVSVSRNKIKLVDPADLEERSRTRYILDENPLKYIPALAAALTRRPGRLFKTAFCAVKMMRHSYRSPIYHLAYFAEAIVLARWLLSQDVKNEHNINSHLRRWYTDIDHGALIAAAQRPGRSARRCVHCRAKMRSTRSLQDFSRARRPIASRHSPCRREVLVETSADRR